MVPIRTENKLHFTARLDGVSSAMKVRFELAVRSYRSLRKKLKTWEQRILLPYYYGEDVIESG